MLQTFNDGLIRLLRAERANLSTARKGKLDSFCGRTLEPRPARSARCRMSGKVDSPEMGQPWLYPGLAFMGFAWAFVDAFGQLLLPSSTRERIISGSPRRS